MQPVSGSLSQAELDRLDDFLLYRGRTEDEMDAEPPDPERDEGVLTVPGLDGFLTAIVSGPAMIMPSRWLAAIWGDEQPVWNSMDEAQTVTGLIMRHMNAISDCLMQQPDAFEPIFFEREVEGKIYTIVDEWCEGYLRGMNLDAANWREGGEEVKRLLTPIMAFTEQAGWPAHDLPMTDLQRMQAKIGPSAQGLHAYWLKRREEFMPAAVARPQGTVRREGPRVGRNDPCPCGSGKKFKKCCMH